MFTLEHFTHWLELNPHLGGLITFLLSAAESVAIIGTIVPGTLVMASIGALIGAEILPLYSTLTWAIAGAVVGDSLSYMAGYYFKDRLHYCWPFNRWPNLLTAGETYFLKHGGKSVFVGRFVGPVRAIVPLVAGMMHMKPGKFLLANVTSAIGWAPLYIAPGLFLGAATLHFPRDIAIHWVINALIICLLAFFVIKLIIATYRVLSKRFNIWLDKAWIKLKNHQSPLCFWFKHYDYNRGHGQLNLLFALIIIGILFIILATLVAQQGIITHINLPFYHFFRGIRVNGLDTIMLRTTFFGDKEVILPACLAIFAFMLLAKNFRTAWHWLALTVITSGSIKLVKLFIHESRPGGLVDQKDSYSFPSGHVTLSVALFGFLIYILSRQISKPKLRRWFRVICVTIISLIAISRMYLGAHWFGDVIGGLLLGLICLWTVLLNYNRYADKKLPIFSFIFITLASLWIGWNIYFNRNYHRLIHHDVMISHPISDLKTKSWWQGPKPHSLVPTFRNNRIGHPAGLLNIQWAGSGDNIEQALSKQGWKIASHLNWGLVFQPDQLGHRAQLAPLIPPLFDDMTPTMTLVKEMGHRQNLILYLWDSHIRLMPGNTPLWVGSLSLQDINPSWIKKTRPINQAIDLTAYLSNFSYKTAIIPKTSDSQFHPHFNPTLLIMIKSKEKLNVR